MMKVDIWLGIINKEERGLEIKRVWCLYGRVGTYSNEEIFDKEAIEKPHSGW